MKNYWKIPEPIFFKQRIALQVIRIDYCRWRKKHLYRQIFGNQVQTCGKFEKKKPGKLVWKSESYHDNSTQELIPTLTPRHSPGQIRLSSRPTWHNIGMNGCVTPENGVRNVAGHCFRGWYEVQACNVAPRVERTVIGGGITLSTERQ